MAKGIARRLRLTQKINFDVALLGQAASTADRLADPLARATMDRANNDSHYFRKVASAARSSSPDTPGESE